MVVKNQIEWPINTRPQAGGRNFDYTEKCYLFSNKKFLRKNFADVDIVMAGLCRKLGVRLLHVIRNYGLPR